MWVEIGIAALGVYFVWKLLAKTPATLPPGPKPLPLLGNIFDMPRNHEAWIRWAKLGEQYGDMCSLSVLGNTFIILNSWQLAIEILEKKGSIYSDRPTLRMGGELGGWNQTTVLLPYGESFRTHRRNLRLAMGTSASLRQFHYIEEAEVRKFLRHLLDNPENLMAAIRHMLGAIILKISHGYEVRKEDDPLVALADKANSQFSSAILPGANLVDVISFLKYIPAWFPGAGFKRRARHMLDTLNELADKPYQMVIAEMAAGTAPPSCMSMLLKDKEITEENGNSVKWSVGTLYIGGAETSTATIYAFFLAMTIHPEIQQKARTEIDAVCGPDRLPTCIDRDNLPYMNAVCLEVHRWHAVVPTGVPHCAREDDTHEGYFIPKGSWIIANAWKMLHDSCMYPDPFKFDPTRYLGLNPQPDPRNIAFGFGRRICPGRALADQTVFIACAQSLAVFDIGKVVENGVPVVPVHEQCAGIISNPGLFKCSIKPRSRKAIELVD